MSLSPLVLTGVTPFDDLVELWFSSKSMLVVPDGSCTRDQNSARCLPVGFEAVTVPCSVKMPNAFRSLLFGGIWPATMLGTAVSSLVPLPKDSSLWPLGESFFATTPVRRPVPVPPVSQSIHPVVLTTRLASVSTSNALPFKVCGLLQLVVVP